MRITDCMIIINCTCVHNVFMHCTGVILVEIIVIVVGYFIEAYYTSLFIAGLCCVLDIVSVFAGKLVIDNCALFDDLIASVFVGNASVFASKLDIDGWAPFYGSVQALGASGTIFYITIKVSPQKDLPSTVFLS